MQVPPSNMTTTPDYPGREIREVLGIVTAECVLGVNIFRDLLGGLRDIVGGRSGTHQKALQQARETCLEDLAQKAGELGANAVVGVDLDYNEISGGGKGMLFLVASGTAVRVTFVEASQAGMNRRSNAAGLLPRTARALDIGQSYETGRKAVLVTVCCYIYIDQQ